VILTVLAVGFVALFMIVGTGFAVYFMYFRQKETNRALNLLEEARIGERGAELSLEQGAYTTAEKQNQLAKELRNEAETIFENLNKITYLKRKPVYVEGEKAKNREPFIKFEEEGIVVNFRRRNV